MLLAALVATLLTATPPLALDAPTLEPPPPSRSELQAAWAARAAELQADVDRINARLADIGTAPVPVLIVAGVALTFYWGGAVGLGASVIAVPLSIFLAGGRFLIPALIVAGASVVAFFGGIGLGTLILRIDRPRRDEAERLVAQKKRDEAELKDLRLKLSGREALPFLPLAVLVF